MDIVDEVKSKLSKKIIKFFEKNPQRFYIDISCEDIFECTKVLFLDLGLRFAIATGIDTRSGFEILYHFSHDRTGKMFTIKVLIPDKKNPEIESITSVVKGALWIERELWELLGINFKNHPDLKHLVLADEWSEGNYPLRRSGRDNR